MIIYKLMYHNFTLAGEELSLRNSHTFRTRTRIETIFQASFSLAREMNL